MEEIDNILHPTIINIDGRLYRKYNVAGATDVRYVDGNNEGGDYRTMSAVASDWFTDEGAGGTDEPRIEQRNTREQPYRERDDFIDEPTEEGDDDIIECAQGFTVAMEIAPSYHGSIIGKKGDTKRHIEQNTGTKIYIPSRHSTKAELVITGHTKSGVASARSRIELIVDKARSFKDMTHFISIPLNCKIMGDTLEEFKADVLREFDGDMGICSEIFQNRLGLHMTIGVLPLLCTGEIDKTIAVLHECQEDIIPNILGKSPLIVRLEGLAIMNDDPSSVNVLYGKVSASDGSNRLQILADALLDRFLATGLMMKERRDSVKLHVTLLKSKRTVRAFDRQPFDATNILMKFGNHYFGEQHIKQIHLSCREEADDGSYIPEAFIDI